jgi:hypothetical protein
MADNQASSGYDVRGMINDPEFQKMSPMDQQSTLNEADPEFGKLSEADFGATLRAMRGEKEPPPSKPVTGTTEAQVKAYKPTDILESTSPTAAGRALDAVINRGAALIPGTKEIASEWAAHPWKNLYGAAKEAGNLALSMMPQEDVIDPSKMRPSQTAWEKFAHPYGVPKEEKPPIPIGEGEEAGATTADILSAIQPTVEGVHLAAQIPDALRAMRLGKPISSLAELPKIDWTGTEGMRIEPSEAPVRERTPEEQRMLGPRRVPGEVKPEVTGRAGQPVPQVPTGTVAGPGFVARGGAQRLLPAAPEPPTPPRPQNVILPGEGERTIIDRQRLESLRSGQPIGAPPPQVPTGEIQGPGFTARGPQRLLPAAPPPPPEGVAVPGPLAEQMGGMVQAGQVPGIEPEPVQRPITPEAVKESEQAVGAKPVEVPAPPAAAYAGPERRVAQIPVEEERRIVQQRLAELEKATAGPPAPEEVRRQIIEAQAARAKAELPKAPEAAPAEPAKDTAAERAAETPEQKEIEEQKPPVAAEAPREIPKAPAATAAPTLGQIDTPDGTKTVRILSRADGKVTAQTIGPKSEQLILDEAKVTPVDKAGNEIPWEGAVTAPAVPSKDIATNHNKLAGFTWNQDKGFVRDMPVFSVAGEHGDLDQVIPGQKITPEQVEAFANRPEVKAALAKGPEYSIGGYRYKGNSILEVSKLFDNEAEAIAEGRRLNQESIYDHKNRALIQTGGTAADEALAKAGIKPAEEPAAAPTAEEAKAAEPPTPTAAAAVNKPLEATGEKMTDSSYRRLQHIVGDRMARFLRNTPDEMLEKAATKATRKQLAQFANENGIFMPKEVDPTGVRSWAEDGSDFKRNVKEHGKDLHPNKEHVLNQVLEFNKRNQFVQSILGDTGEAGAPARVVPPTGHTPPPATMATARMSNDELLAHGFTQDDIDNARHLPTVSGGAEGLKKLAESKEIPPEFAEHMTPEEIASVQKGRTGVTNFVKNMAKLPPMQEFIDIAMQGSGGRFWYQRGRAAIKAMMEEAPKYFSQEGDEERFLGMLAGSSPRQSVAMNMREALGAWKEWNDAGRPEMNVGDWKKFVDGENVPNQEAYRMMQQNFTSAESKVPNVIKGLNRENLWPDLTKNNAFKVPSFNQNLKGWLNYSTNDGWMGLFGNLTASDLSKPAGYHPLSVMTRAAAKALGWETAEAQASIWSFTQALTNLKEAGYSTANITPELVRLYNQDFRDILANDQQVRDILADLGVSHEQLDQKLAAIGDKPQVAPGTTSTTGHSIRQLEGRIQAARKSGKAPGAKIEGQGELFREPPPTRAAPEAGDVTFNPAEFGAEPTIEPEARAGRTRVELPRQPKSPSGGFPGPAMAELPSQQGGHAGGGVTSVEEMSRPGTHYTVSQSGVTYHGKQFAPESTPRGSSHVTVRADGSYLVNDGRDLNPAQERILSQAVGKKVRRAY